MAPKRRMLLPRRAQIQRAQTQSVYSAFPQQRGFYSKFKSLFSSIWKKIFPPAPNVVTCRSPRQDLIYPISFYTQTHIQQGPFKKQTGTVAPTPGRFQQRPILKRPRQNHQEIGHQLKKLKVDYGHPKYQPKMTQQTFKPSMKITKHSTPFWNKNKFRAQDQRNEETKVEKEEMKSVRTEITGSHQFEFIKGVKNQRRGVEKTRQSVQVIPQVTKVPKTIRSQEKIKKSYEQNQKSVCTTKIQELIQAGFNPVIEEQKKLVQEPKTQVNTQNQIIKPVGFKPSDVNLPEASNFRLLQKGFNPFIQKPFQASAVEEKLNETKVLQKFQDVQNQVKTPTNTQQNAVENSPQKSNLQDTPTFKNAQSPTQIQNPQTTLTSNIPTEINPTSISIGQNLFQSKFEAVTHQNNPFVKPSIYSSNQYPNTKPKFVFGAQNQDPSSNPFGVQSYNQVNPFVSNFQSTQTYNSGFQHNQIREVNPFAPSNPFGVNQTIQPSFPTSMNGSSHIQTNPTFASSNVLDNQKSFSSQYSSDIMQTSQFLPKFQYSNQGYFPTRVEQNQNFNQPIFQVSVHGSSSNAMNSGVGSQGQSTFSLGMIQQKRNTKGRRNP